MCDVWLRSHGASAPQPVPVTLNESGGNDALATSENSRLSTSPAQLQYGIEARVVRYVFSRPDPGLLASIWRAMSTARRYVWRRKNGCRLMFNGVDLPFRVSGLHSPVSDPTAAVGRPRLPARLPSAADLRVAPARSVRHLPNVDGACAHAIRGTPRPHAFRSGRSSRAQTSPGE